MSNDASMKLISELLPWKLKWFQNRMFRISGQMALTSDLSQINNLNLLSI
jgi:hypothetical protein